MVAPALICPCREEAVADLVCGGSGVAWRVSDERLLTHRKPQRIHSPARHVLVECALLHADDVPLGLRSESIVARALVRVARGLGKLRWTKVEESSTLVRGRTLVQRRFFVAQAVLAEFDAKLAEEDTDVLLFGTHLPSQCHAFAFQSHAPSEARVGGRVARRSLGYRSRKGHCRHCERRGT